MKKILILLLSLILVLCAFSGVYSAEYEPPEDIYVADFADVIEKSVENHIITTGEKLYELTGAQIVVVTIDFANGDLEDVAYNIFNDWGIGDAQLNNGILILMSIGDQDAWVLQGAGLERDLPASSISNMMDYYLADYFFDGEYSKGAESIFDAFADLVCNYYGVSLNSSTGYPQTNSNVYPSNNKNNNYNDDKDSGSVLGFIIIVVIVIIIIRSSRKRRYYGSGSPYRRYNNTYVSRNDDDYEDYNSYRRPSSGSSSSSSRSRSYGGGKSRGGGSGFSSGSRSSFKSSSSSGSRSSFKSSSSSRSRSSSSGSGSRSSSRGSSFGGGKSRGGGGGFGKR